MANPFPFEPVMRCVESSVVYTKVDAVIYSIKKLVKFEEVSICRVLGLSAAGMICIFNAFIHSCTEGFIKTDPFCHLFNQCTLYTQGCQYKIFFIYFCIYLFFFVIIFIHLIYIFVLIMCM